MSDTNLTVQVGRATRDVEVRYVGDKQQAVAEFGLAVNGRVKDKVSFFTVVVWGKQAELAAEYVKKGKQVSVTGHLEEQTWEKDGEKRSKVVIVGDHVQFLADPRGTGTAKAVSSDSPAAEPKKEDEIPF